jgi:mycothiol synthase
MQIMQRRFSGESDISAMAALVHDFPVGDIHAVDLPYRLCSWAFDHPENASLWFNEKQELVGWAVLQTPFWTIDHACHPKAGSEILSEMFSWADSRARQVAGTPDGHPAWFVKVFPTQMERIRTLETFGFIQEANVGKDSWSDVFLQHAGKVPKTRLPRGFTIRPLAGREEVDACVELHRSVFESKNMTREWRMRTLARPERVPNLDLVAVAPDGRLAAFCIGWLGRTSNGVTEGQIEPLGVHADFRKLGLGRAILSEELQRFKQHHAENIYIITDNYRNAAVNLYESVGFHVSQNILIFRKNYE